MLFPADRQVSICRELRVHLPNGKKLLMKKEAEAARHAMVDKIGSKLWLPWIGIIG